MRSISGESDVGKPFFPFSRESRTTTFLTSDRQSRAHFVTGTAQSHITTGNSLPQVAQGPGGYRRFGVNILPIKLKCICSR